MINEWRNKIEIKYFVDGIRDGKSFVAFGNHLVWKLVRLRQVADDFSTRIPFAANGAETLFSENAPDEGEFVDENGREGERFDREFEECEKVDENFFDRNVYIGVVDSR